MNESEESFKLLFERSIDPAFLVDGDTRTYIDCNESALKFLCCPAKEQLTGLHPVSISPKTQPDGSMSSEKARELFDTVLHDGAIRFEWNHNTFDGKDVWVDISLTTIPYRGRQIIHTLWRNISKRKKMEKKLAAEMQRFLTVIENMPSGIMLLDEKRNCTYMNAKFQELFGYDLRDLPDESAWFAKAYPDPEYRSQVFAALRKDINGFNIALKEGEKWTFTVTCKDGREKTVHIIHVQLPTGEYLKAYEDITEQKKADGLLRSREEELAIKSANLQDMNAALRVLLSQRENDKAELEAKIVRNVNKLVMPYVDELKQCRLGPSHTAYVDIIEANLKQIISPFLEKLGLRSVNLTPREMRIADLIKSGKATKEISQLLQISSAAVNFHRNNIRRKLGINNHKVNLAPHLSSL
ncbi:MAG: PAS domain S-box protein [Syntrophorhabdaceae bacterium]|nr:PAS domain S-box protein [Syntrophorhabdaceae bacterium]